MEYGLFSACEDDTRTDCLALEFQCKKEKKSVEAMKCWFSVFWIKEP